MQKIKVIKKVTTAVEVNETVDTAEFSVFDFSLVYSDEELIRKKRLFLNGAGVLRKAAQAIDEMVSRRDKALCTK